MAAVGLDARIGGSARSVAASVCDSLRSRVGAFVRDRLFFPVHTSADLRAQLPVEQAFADEFWHNVDAVHPSLQEYTKVHRRYDHKSLDLTLFIREGLTITMTVGVNEVKWREDIACSYLFVMIPGNFSTSSSDLAHMLPFMKALEDKRTLNARFVTLSQYDLRSGGEPYKPASLDEAGLILAKAIESLSRNYGQIDEIFAHSLGSILFTVALDHVNRDMLPKTIALHCAPASIYATFNKTWLGRVVYPLAAWSGWSANLEKRLIDMTEDLAERNIELVVSGMKQDHYFSGDANLCSSTALESCGAVRLCFDLPRQMYHEHAHHNLRVDLLYGAHLTQPNTFVKRGETYAAALIQRTLGQVASGR